MPSPAVHPPPDAFDPDSDVQQRRHSPAAPVERFQSDVTPSVQRVESAQNVNDLVTADTAPIRLPAAMPLRPAGLGPDAPVLEVDSEAMLVEETDAEAAASLDPEAEAIIEAESEREPITTAGISDDPASRARRSTPKQRPVNRRGRQLDASRTTGPGRSQVLKGNRAPARVLGSGTDDPSQSRIGSGGFPSSGDDGGGSTSRNGSSGAPFTPRSNGAGHPEREPRRRDTRNERVRLRDEAAARQALASPTTVPHTRLLTDGRPIEAHGQRGEPAPHARAEIGRAQPDRPSLHSTMPVRPPAVRGRPSPHPVFPSPPTPRLSADAIPSVLPSVIVTPSRPSPQSGYEPLPRDRAGFEAFMRQRAAEAEANGARPNWKEQETLLIPREALDEEAQTGSRVVERVIWVAGAALAIVLIAGATMWIKQRATDAHAVRSIPIASQEPGTQSAAVETLTTLIATEPSGAELLLRGAVLGNTPVEVTRPPHGDEMYYLRMRGFESQLVRVSPHSGSAIRVMLLPASSVGSAPSPAPAR